MFQKVISWAIIIHQNCRKPPLFILACSYILFRLKNKPVFEYKTLDFYCLRKLSTTFHILMQTLIYQAWAACESNISKDCCLHSVFSSLSFTQRRGLNIIFANGFVAVILLTVALAWYIILFCFRIS